MYNHVRAETALAREKNNYCDKNKKNKTSTPTRPWIQLQVCSGRDVTVTDTRVRRVSRRETPEKKTEGATAEVATLKTVKRVREDRSSRRPIIVYSIIESLLITT